MLSQFESGRFWRNSTSVLQHRAIDVMFDSNVNHFGLNDYAAEFGHVKTKCAWLIGGGKDFRTTPNTQRNVVTAIADILALAYYAYVGGGDAQIRHIAMQIRNVSFVQNVLFKV